MASSGKVESADFSFEKILKAFCFLYLHTDRLIGCGEFDRAATAARTATLKDDDIVFAGLGHIEIPSDPVLGVRPISHGVLIPLRLISNGVPMNDDISSPQENCAWGRCWPALVTSGRFAQGDLVFDGHDTFLVFLSEPDQLGG